MIKSDFMKIYEELSNLNSLQLNERWHSTTSPFGKFWYTRSKEEFKTFILSTLPSLGIKAARIVIDPEIPLFIVGDADIYDHTMLSDFASSELCYPIHDRVLEYYSLGLPTCENYYIGNYEYNANIEEAKELCKGRPIAVYPGFEVVLEVYNIKDNQIVKDYKAKFGNIAVPPTNDYYEDTLMYRLLKDSLVKIYIYKGDSE